MRQAQRQAEHELMHPTFIAAIVFVCPVAAGFGALLISERFPPRYRHDDTHNVVRLTANIFVVTTSLLLGLLLNSAKNTFEGVDSNVHAFATDIFLLMLGAWLVLIFGSFGYRAPRNAVVLGTLVAAAFLITTSIYLVLDMDVPF